MSDKISTLDDLRASILMGDLNRRQVLQRALALGLSAPVVAGLLAACGDDDDDDDDDTPDPPAQDPDDEEDDEPEDEVEEPDEEDDEDEEDEDQDEPSAPMTRGGGGKITLLYWQAVTILTMHLSQGTKDTHAAQVVIEPLAYLGENEEPQLVLASEWPSIEDGTLDPDGLWVIWKLKEGVRWHDGEPFTAEDVRLTWEYVTNEDTTATTVATYNPVESVEVIDDYTVQVNFHEPNPAWFDVFVGNAGGIIPAHIMQDFVGEAARDAPFNLAPIGTGPWKVSLFNPGDTVIYEINEDYHIDGIPFFDEVEIKGGGDAASAARAVLVTGEVDWAWNLQVEPEILQAMEAEGGQGQLTVAPGTSAERIYINFADPNTEIDGARSEPTTEHPIWQHKEAREALNLAIRRDLVAEQLYGTDGEPTGDSMNVPERFKLNWPWEFDLDAAREKLAEIDFPDAFDNVRLLYQTSTNAVRQKNQEIVKEDLEQLGFQVELKNIDAGVYFSSDAGNPDTLAHFYADIQMYTNGPTSPYPIAWAERFRSDQIAEKANNWAGTNSMRYFNPAYDELHDRAKTAMDEDEQVEIWTEMLSMAYEDIVEVPIVWRGALAAVHNRINYLDSGPWQPRPIDQLKFWTLNE